MAYLTLVLGAFWKKLGIYPILFGMNIDSRHRMRNYIKSLAIALIGWD
jgi:hypothetical protein